MAPSTSKNIAIIVALSTIAFVFTSSLIISSEHAAQAKPNKKDIEKIIKKVREKLRDNDDIMRDDDKEDDDKEEKQEANTDYDYGFSDEGDTKRKNFNFVAAGDYGCSKNKEHH